MDDELYKRNMALIHNYPEPAYIESQLAIIQNMMGNIAQNVAHLCLRVSSIEKAINEIQNDLLWK